MFPECFKDIPLCERIFCNRSLNMTSIKAVGFDMDYTLAIYKHETFEKLAYDETIKKLVKMGYPSSILKWHFDPKYMVRGLVIDKKRGNILKIDRHRYVKIAYHGKKELTRNERRNLYDLANVIVYEEPDFALIDTIFSLAEAFLFSQLVDLKENTSELSEKPFIQIHQDVRKCIDLCHRDGSIKHKVAENPAKYINFDPYLKDVLMKLKSHGHKLFVLTNSLWDYTNVVMNFLLGKKDSFSTEWTNYFDVILTGSQKPNFFTVKNPLYEVHMDTGLLKNFEVLPSAEKTTSYPKVFQGGHVKLLHDMLNIQKGSEILYVGDHIYGDILRSKKEIGWRTMLVIEELETEIMHLHKQKNEFDLCNQFIFKQDALSDQLEELELAIQAKKQNQVVENKVLIDLPIEELEKQFKKTGYDIAKIMENEEKTYSQYCFSFHPIWGQLMKTGRQNSRFSAQVINYSCIYTSKISNLRHYGMNKNFQAVSDHMPHDAILNHKGASC